MIAIARRMWRGLHSVALDLSDLLLVSFLRIRFFTRSLLGTRHVADTHLDPFDVPVCVINLKKRPDRLQQVTENLKKIGFRDIRVIEAVDGPLTFPTLVRGHAANLGCTLSHQAAVEQFLTSDGPIAICEDDNEFLVPSGVIKKLIQKFLDNSNLDVLGLSVRVRGRKYLLDDDFSLVNWALAPAFYIIKPRARKRLLASYEESARRLRAQKRRGPFDQVWRHAQRFSLLFAVPHLRSARQRESFSDIQDQHFGGT